MAPWYQPTTFAVGDLLGGVGHHVVGAHHLDVRLELLDRGLDVLVGVARAR
jgi:hypothetical protein